MAWRGRLAALLAVFGAACAATWAEPLEPPGCGACALLERQAARRADACVELFAAAQAHRITPDSEEYQVKAAVAVWKEARLGCGDLWTWRHQRAWERMRIAVGENVAARARARCGVSVRALYAQVDAADLGGAEAALTGVRDACAGTPDDRARIVAAEKLLTQVRRVEGYRAVLVQQRDVARRALDLGDLTTAREIVARTPGVAALLREDEVAVALVRDHVLDSARDVVAGRRPRAARARVCAARELFVQVIGAPAWDRFVGAAAPRLGTGPVRGRRVLTAPCE